MNSTFQSKLFVIGKFLFFLGFYAIGLNSIHAQTPDVKVRFRTLGWGAIPTDLYFETAKKDTNVSVIGEARSAFYEYIGPSTLTFYRLRPGTDGTMEHVTAGTADVSASGAYPLLIFSKDQQSAEKVRIQVLPDDLKSFPMGSFKFVNYSQKALTAAFGSEKFTLRPEDNRVFAATPDPEKRTRLVQLSRLEGGRSTLLYSNNWALRPQTRTLVFASPDSFQPQKIITLRVTESADVIEAEIEKDTKKP